MATKDWSALSRELSLLGMVHLEYGMRFFYTDPISLERVASVFSESTEKYGGHQYDPILDLSCRTTLMMVVAQISHHAEASEETALETTLSNIMAFVADGEPLTEAVVNLCFCFSED